LIDFFITVGDNIYARDGKYPSELDISDVMGLFGKPSLANISIYAVRGNHDCDAVDRYYQVNMTKKYPYWQMPYLYYDKQFDLGNNKTFGVLFIDSCLLLCANYSYKDSKDQVKKYHLENPEMLKLRDE
jgi:hypothetical protein